MKIDRIKLVLDAIQAVRSRYKQAVNEPIPDLEKICRLKSDLIALDVCLRMETENKYSDDPKLGA